MTRDFLIIPVQSLLGVGGWEWSSPLEWRRTKGRYKWDTGEHSQVCEHAEGTGAADGLEHSICEVSLWQEPACRHAEGMQAGDWAHGRAEETGALAWQGAWSTECPCREGHGRETMGNKPGVAYMQTGTGVPMWAGGLEYVVSCWESYGKVIALELSPGQTRAKAAFWVDGCSSVPRCLSKHLLTPLPSSQKQQDSPLILQCLFSALYWESSTSHTP